MCVCVCVCVWCLPKLHNKQFLLIQKRSSNPVTYISLSNPRKTNNRSSPVHIRDTPADRGVDPGEGVSVYDYGPIFQRDEPYIISPRPLILPPLNQSIKLPACQQITVSSVAAVCLSGGSGSVSFGITSNSGS